MRKILYISGSRADYGPARRVLLALQNDPEIKLGILVTGMHLDPVHGETWKEIEADGFEIIDKIYGRVAGDSLSVMAASVGLYLYGMSFAMTRFKPDIVLVLGDRGEQLAGAMAAAFQNIVVVHLCGGSISGSIDDSIRHAITKFAHYHLPAFEEHARRIIQMGENPETVHVVGLPGGDIRPDVKFSREEICKKYNLPQDKPYILVIQHSVTQTQEYAGQQITETLEALKELDYHVLLANPNDDAGGRIILDKMRQYASAYPHLHILSPPRSRELFASIMANASALVGNSSSAVIEAMSVCLPVVNIGDRQKGREYMACSLNVKHDRKQIYGAIRKAIEDKAYQQLVKNHHLQNFTHSTENQIVNVLKSINIELTSQSKVFFDMC